MVVAVANPQHTVRLAVTVTPGSRCPLTSRTTPLIDPARASVKSTPGVAPLGATTTNAGVSWVAGAGGVARSSRWPPLSLLR